ncbi:putative knottin, scorpion toxin, defensin, plant, knottin, scorpion toxin-like superfamily [Helianthus annuus]|nr:putative knottin, scorpion toxin, defensin, plant, knottin, scorpion toxin-like superfamily [Helianthus annuus]KAJ0441373.1 putative knottin, scorpion toxin, defensin, plant, knottin, scorpion toxin-like superfamily [Helianthus annuus]KAJ0459344.1 putative knottin, scorpion toxin, defensin, plant, knottin, scorpion toxin-like superfamily [Helianthus annuus]KAJ0643836.1 putative knottin, scorpion toxin, defensin, plant, knottin, scorpion toxin-like superfamily [Helianthus annuus]
MNRSVAFSALVLILLVLTVSDITSVRGQRCMRVSRTWAGPCRYDQWCNRQCRLWEIAAGGACQTGACICYYFCPKAEKHTQHKSNAQNRDSDDAKKVVPNVEHP